MSDLAEIKGTGLVDLFHGAQNGVLVPKPFEREIFLFNTYVAGTSHIEGIEAIEKELSLDDRLSFFREPNNSYDNHAIVIKTENDVKIGYVPKVDNVIFSRLMDAGKLLYGKIVQKEMKGTWVKITIDIYLHED